MKHPRANSNQKKEVKAVDIPPFYTLSTTIDDAVNGKYNHSQICDGIPKFCDVVRYFIIGFTPVYGRRGRSPKSYGVPRPHWRSWGHVNLFHRLIEFHFFYSLINVQLTIIAYRIRRVYSMHNTQQLTNQKLFSALKDQTNATKTV